jgi:regulatory protein
MTDEKGINRAKNSLVRYGYDYSDINKAFKQIELEYDEQDG